MTDASHAVVYLSNASLKHHWTLHAVVHIPRINQFTCPFFCGLPPNNFSHIIQSCCVGSIAWIIWFTNYRNLPVASFIKKVNPWLAKHPLKTNGCLANRRLTSLVKEATGIVDIATAKQSTRTQYEVILIIIKQHLIARGIDIISIRQSQYCLISQGQKGPPICHA